MIFDLEEMTKWEYPDKTVYTFKQERHMLEFVSYREVSSFGPTKLFGGIHKFEAIIKPKNVRFK